MPKKQRNQSSDSKNELTDRRSLIAAAEFDESGSIEAANDAFWYLFFDSIDKQTDPFRKHAKVRHMLRDLLKRGRKKEIGRPERRKYGAFDFFYDANNEDSEKRFWIGYKRLSKDLVNRRGEYVLERLREPDRRHFRFKLHKVPRGRSKEKKVRTYMLEIADITVDKLYADFVRESERAFDSSIRKLMIKGKEEDFCLSYVIRPQYGLAGGDFVFAWKLEEKPWLVTVFGDSAGKGILGGYMTSMVGWVLNEICLNPPSEFVGAENPAHWIITRLHKVLLSRQNFTGLDGIICVINLEDQTLYWADGSFEMFLVDMSKPVGNDSLKRVGSNLSSREPSKTPQAERIPGPKSIGVNRAENEDELFECGAEIIDENTLVACFSDGVYDQIDELSLESSDNISPTLHEFLVKRLGTLQIKGNLEYDSLQKLTLDMSEQLAENQLAHPGQISPRLDDELLAVMMPIRAKK